MFTRKLASLGYANHDGFNISDDAELKKLVSWLEDQKIRHYVIEDRAQLRDVKSGSWSKALEKYLNDVGCPVPFTSDTLVQSIEWLLGYAVRLEYADNVKEYAEFKGENVERNSSNAPKVISQNPLDNLNFESDEFKSAVKRLAILLKITPHPDHLITLQAIGKFVRTRLNKTVLDNPKSILVEGEAFPFQEADLGFDTGDYVLNQASKIIRLLYITDLRDLQTGINECIVAVQNVTANPKTDTKLGKVGF